MGLSTSELYLVLRARDEASRVMRGFSATVTSANKEAMAASQALFKRGAALATVGVAVAVVGIVALNALNKMTDAAIKYNEQAALTLTQTDKVNVSFQQLKDMGRDVANTVPIAFEQIQPALYDIFSSISTNAPGAAILLKNIGMAAVGGATEMKIAGRATIAVLNAYKMPAEQVTHVNDIMFQLVRKGVGTYTEFTAVIGRAIPSAIKAGQSFESLGGMMAFLTRNGMSAAQASTSAARALDTLSKPGSIKNLKEMGIAVADSSGKFRPMVDIMHDLQGKLSKLSPVARALKLNDIFKGSGANIQAMRFFNLAIADSNGLLPEMTTAMKNAKGSAADAYKIMANTPQGKIQLMNNKYQVMQTIVGDQLVPAKLKLIEALSKILGWFNKLSPSAQKWIAITLAVTAGLITLTGIILVIVGAILMFAAASAAADIALLPLIGIVLLVIAAIAGLVVGVYFIIKYWTQIKAFTIRIWNDILSWLKGALDSIKSFFSTIWDAITKTIYSTWRDVANFFVGIWNHITSAVTTGIDNVKGWIATGMAAVSNVWHTVWGAISGFVSGVWNAIAGFVTTGINWVRGVIQTGVNFVLGIWRSVWGLFGPLVTAVWHLIAAVIDLGFQIIMAYFRLASQTIRAIWSDVWNWVSSVVSTAWNWVTSVVSTGFNALKDLVTTGLNYIKTGFSDVWNWITSFISSTWNRITGFVSAGWAALKSYVSSGAAFVRATWAVLWDWVSSFVSGVWNRIVGYVSGPLATIKGGIKATWDWVTSATSTAWNSLSSFVSTGINNAMTFITGIKNRVLNSLSDIGNWLKDAGMNLIKGLISGITSMIDKVTSTVSGIANKISHLFPGSPIKSGPLKSWNRGGAGKRLVNLLAEGLSKTGPVDDAMAKLTKSMQAQIAIDGYSSSSGTPALGIANSLAGLSGSSGQTFDQKFYINTQEIDPRKNAADLGWEFASKVRA